LKKSCQSAGLFLPQEKVINNYLFRSLSLSLHRFPLFSPLFFLPLPDKALGWMGCQKNQTKTTTPKNKKSNKIKPRTETAKISKNKRKGSSNKTSALFTNP